LEEIIGDDNTALFCNVNGFEQEDESKSKFNVYQVDVVVSWSDNKFVNILFYLC